LPAVSSPVSQDVDLDGFGDADDVVFPTPPTDAIFSRIASVSIKGIITGTGSTAGDQYGGYEAA